MRLHVGGLRTEELLGTLDGERLHRIDKPAARIPALAGVAFCIFIGKDGALRLADGARREVFGGDQVDAGALLLLVGENLLIDLGIFIAEMRNLDDAVAHPAELVHAAEMTLRFIAFGRQEQVEQRRQLLIDGKFGAEHEHVGIVVLAGEHEPVGGLRQRGAHMREAIGRDADADARVADQDAAVRFARFHGGRYLFRIQRIIAGKRIEGADVYSFNIRLSGEEFAELLFDGKTGVVGTNGKNHG